eukprot:TRINITY_DN6431_c0_g1_i1.p1 TRINITY_DN6431_c0_g1~~TRINITY_DN6431_c0_g1_i1.p1  ORF type:complete len:850 (-),score=124.29 TRINITY_DN6431_c0_g1_i1:25-2535(-)
METQKPSNPSSKTGRVSNPLFRRLPCRACDLVPGSSIELSSHRIGAFTLRNLSNKTRTEFVINAGTTVTKYGSFEAVDEILVQLCIPLDELVLEAKRQFDLDHFVDLDRTGPLPILVVSSEQKITVKLRSCAPFGNCCEVTVHKGKAAAADLCMPMPWEQMWQVVSLHVKGAKDAPLELKLNLVRGFGLACDESNVDEQVRLVTDPAAALYVETQLHHRLQNLNLKEMPESELASLARQLGFAEHPKLRERLMDLQSVTTVGALAAGELHQHMSPLIEALSAGQQSTIQVPHAHCFSAQNPPAQVHKMTRHIGNGDNFDNGGGGGGGGGGFDWFGGALGASCSLILALGREFNSSPSRTVWERAAAVVQQTVFGGFLGVCTSAAVNLLAQAGAFGAMVASSGCPFVPLALCTAACVGEWLRYCYVHIKEGPKQARHQREIAARNTLRWVVGVVPAAGLAWNGFAVGGLIVPGAGNLIGALVGGLLGALLGSYFREKLLPELLHYNRWLLREQMAVHGWDMWDLLQDGGIKKLDTLFKEKRKSDLAALLSKSELSWWRRLDLKYHGGAGPEYEELRKTYDAARQFISENALPKKPIGLNMSVPFPQALVGALKTTSVANITVKDMIDPIREVIPDIEDWAEAAESWVQSNLDLVTAAGLDLVGAVALRLYTGELYKPINSLLNVQYKAKQGREVLMRPYLKFMRVALKALGSLSADHHYAAPCYRVQSNSFGTEGPSPQFLAKFSPGSQQYWWAFLSTTKSAVQAAHFAPETDLFIDISFGPQCHGFNIDFLSVYPDEGEVLLPPMAVFTVSSAPQRLANNTWHLALSLTQCPLLYL